jgi:hypothetical protein
MSRPRPKSVGKQFVTVKSQLPIDYDNTVIQYEAKGKRPEGSEDVHHRRQDTRPKASRDDASGHRI